MAEALSILCVDDDEDILFVNALALGLDRDLTVSTALGPIAALDVLRAPDHTFDGILLDVQMPGMSGIEMLDGIRAIDRYVRTPVIFLTASVREADAARYAALGAAGLIAKPYDPLSLAAKVRRMVTS